MQLYKEEKSEKKAVLSRTKCKKQRNSNKKLQGRGEVNDMNEHPNHELRAFIAWDVLIERANESRPKSWQKRWVSIIGYAVIFWNIFKTIVCKKNCHL